MGRKAHAIWEFDDSLKIKMPGVKDSSVEVDGFECGNCGFQMRTTSVPRILAHHTGETLICSMHSVAKPCNKAKTTGEKIAKYKAMLAAQTKKKEEKINNKVAVAETRGHDEADRAERTSTEKRQSRIKTKLIQDEEVDNAIHDFFVGEDIALRKGTCGLASRSQVPPS
jgi:hypothetical protein